jgi:antitoxin VapB
MLSIRNPETDRLARELARRRGETLTEAVTVALRAQLAREPEAPVRKLASFEEIMATVEEIRRLMPPEFFEQEDPSAFLYDPETGLPA